jgi:hypothetical protein
LPGPIWLIGPGGVSQTEAQYNGHHDRREKDATQTCDPIHDISLLNIDRPLLVFFGTGVQMIH